MWFDHGRVGVTKISRSLHDLMKGILKSLTWYCWGRLFTVEKWIAAHLVKFSRIFHVIVQCSRESKSLCSSKLLVTDEIFFMSLLSSANISNWWNQENHTYRSKIATAPEYSPGRLLIEQIYMKIVYQYMKHNDNILISMIGTISTGFQLCQIFITWKGAQGEVPSRMLFRSRYIVSAEVLFSKASITIAKLLSNWVRQDRFWRKPNWQLEIRGLANLITCLKINNSSILEVTLNKEIGL